MITSAVGVLVSALSWPALRNLFARRQLMNASFNRWQIANAYGAFGTVTKERIELVVEGSADDDALLWREYEFTGKPRDVRRMPGQFAPYHLRLDWLMWFLPLGRSLDDWFTVFLLRLLEADAPTLALLRSDPFEGSGRGGCERCRTGTASRPAPSGGRTGCGGCGPVRPWCSARSGCGEASASPLPCVRLGAARNEGDLALRRSFHADPSFVASDLRRTARWLDTAQPSTAAERGETPRPDAGSGRSVPPRRARVN